jgi:cobalt-zinc-cadmium efflux system outer membrane protein
VAGERRVTLGAANATLARRAAGIADARLRAGDISDLEARAARSDASQVEATLRALEHEREVARLALLSRIGLDRLSVPLTLDAAPPKPAAPCGGPDDLVKEALASRPDVRAAEIAVEAAGRRAAWERTRVLSLIATLDANGAGREGYEQGPGVIADVPLFNRNQGAISRATAELDRASRTYLAVRIQVGAEVRTSLIRLTQARQALESLQRTIVPSLEIEQRQAESAYQAGEVSLLTMLDASRRLLQARTRELDATIDLQTAGVLLDQRVGRICGGS